MVPNSTPTTFILLFFGVSILILIMLLPALLELKKPKDSGPRIILDDVPVLQRLQIRTMVQIANMEEELGLDYVAVKKIANAIAILPNLET